jgi:endonuclease/exonuclease/phosphatase family metal-dependent hydrolase
MFTRHLLPALLIWGLLYTPAQAGPSDREIRIATLNCEFLLKKKIHIKFGKPFNLSRADQQVWERPGFRDAKLREASKAIAQIIKKIDADVIALCEVGPEEDVQVLHEEVAALGIDYPHVAVGDSADTMTGQHVAVFSKHPFERIVREIRGRAFYLEEPDDAESESDTGISKGLHVMFQARERRVNLFVVHLSSEGGGYEKDAQRIAQASIVRRNYLKSLNEGEHVVVMGDLNDYRGQPTLCRIRGLDDIFEDLIQPAGSAFNRKKRNESDEQYNARIRQHWTYEFAGQKNQIDHILISQSIKDETLRQGVLVQFVDTSEKIAGTDFRATDHRAVVLDLTLKP